MTNGTEKSVLEGFRSGYLTIVGQPNVGKSTLLNQILGEKIAITSPKPQTTRDRLVGIKHLSGAQLVFLDTPGIHAQRVSKLNEVMVDAAIATLTEVDVIVFVVDAAWQVANDGEPLEGDLAVLEAIKQSGKPTILALNKVDKVQKERLLPAIAAWKELHDFVEIIPLSATEGENVPELVSAAADRLSEGPPYFPEDMVTDRSMRFLMSEVIREKLFLRLGQELPYAVAVEIEDWKDAEEITRIMAVIHVERDSQKKIVIGAKGEKIKEVGILARKDMEAFLGRRVYLELFVRVEPDWTQKVRSLERFGYRVAAPGSKS